MAEAAEAYVERRLDEALEDYDTPPTQRALEAEKMLVQADGCHIRCGKWMTAKQADDPEQLARLAGCDDDEKVRLVEWKEMRTGIVRRMGQVEATYVSQRGQWEQVAGQLFRAACGHGLSFETQVVAVADGAYGLKDAPDHSAVTTAYGRLDRLIGYLTRFYNCLDYRKYRQNGWPIGSGEVESAHKTVPQGRLKLPGATWSEENISKMCALRAVQANGWWDDFWEYEHDRRQAA